LLLVVVNPATDVVHGVPLITAESYDHVMLFVDVFVEHSRVTRSSFSATWLVGDFVIVPTAPTATSFRQSVQRTMTDTQHRALYDGSLTFHYSELRWPQPWEQVKDKNSWYCFNLNVMAFSHCNECGL